MGDLGNTAFSCQNMHAVLDSMVAVIEPGMERQFGRWGGNLAGWQVELQELRDFITSDVDEVVGGMEDCYDVTSVNLTIDIVGFGEVEINTVDYTPDMVPATTWYFVDVPITLEAEEDFGVGFLFWEIVGGRVDCRREQPRPALTLTGDAHLIAHFGLPMPPEEVTFNVSPAGTGDILLDGVAFTSYPATETIDVGSHNLQAEAMPWWLFSHWSLDGNGEPR